MDRDESDATARGKSYLDGEVIRTVRQMVTAAEWRVLLTHVHLEMREEVDVLLRDERKQGANATCKSRCMKEG